MFPDKNSSPEAIEAFKVVQESYECLSEDACRKSYDRRLSEEEEGIAQFRTQIKRQLISKVFQAVSTVHYYVSVAAFQIYQTGLDFWDLAGELEVQILGQPRPIGEIFTSAFECFNHFILVSLFQFTYSPI